VKPFAWSPETNAQLLAERQLCFEAVVVAIAAGELRSEANGPERPADQHPPLQR
jgi:hypothetical protein